jgi:tRNA threonylcarbamoyladenosine biosynthesis protein TsaE
MFKLLLNLSGVKRFKKIRLRPISYGMKIVSKSLSDTQKIAKDFIGKISMGVYNTALVVGLYGDLGSGKTTFTQAVAKIFDIKDDITSPTFVIEKIYDIEHPSQIKSQFDGASKDFKKLVHIDAYRLDSAKELSALDWDKTLADSRNIIFIEWPERVLEVLPKNHAKINFKFLSENEREIEI